MLYFIFKYRYLYMLSTASYTYPQDVNIIYVETGTLYLKKLSYLCARFKKDIKISLWQTLQRH